MTKLIKSINSLIHCSLFNSQESLFIILLKRLIKAKRAKNLIAAHSIKTFNKFSF